MNYWLMKSEPSDFSIDDLRCSEKKKTAWTGVRNYQARNYMRDGMLKGDLVFFYHSSCPEPGVVGVCKVISEPYPDPTAFDKKSKYFDPRSSSSNIRWVLVDIQLVEIFSQIVSLKMIKGNSFFKDMPLVKKGRTPSVQPVEKKYFDKIYSLSSNS